MAAYTYDNARGEELKGSGLLWEAFDIHGGG